MARNRTLLGLVRDVRIAARISLNDAHLSADKKERIVQDLQETQEWLWADYNWPHLVVRRDIPLQAGVRFYEPPTDVDLTRIIDIKTSWDTDWFKIENNLTEYDYSLYDSENDERYSPALKWRFWENEEIEIWPLPSENGDPATKDNYIRITGIRNLTDLVDDNDTADLDGLLLVWYTAGRYLQTKKDPRAETLLAQANIRYGRLKANQASGSTFKMFSPRRLSSDRPRFDPYINYRKPGD